MKLRNTKGSRYFVAAALVALIATSLPPYPDAAAARVDASRSKNQTASSSRLTVDPDAIVFTLHEHNGGIGCRDATTEEATIFRERDPNMRLHRISPEQRFNLSMEGEGLQIILRATDQLEGFPAAKEAFLRAAGIWEGVIQNAITIVIDVDFGPQFFGTQFGNGVLGATSMSTVGSDNFYPQARTSLLNSASSDQEAAIYNLLPQGTVPTDIGSTARVFTAAPTLRAIGELPAVADPDAEEAQLGPPPRIGFNSNVSFDFDPSDGIDPNQIDFEAVATHEIGHALGFSSSVGRRELNPNSAISLTLWDLFRFRPRTAQNAFSTAQRVLASGGEQRFVAAGLEVPVSTGRPDGNGGDGNQASHWKADELTGRYIGIMDPTVARGQREVITSHDLIALETFGYKITAGTNKTAESGDFFGVITGDNLTITGAVADFDGDVAQAQIQLLGSFGQPINLPVQFPLASGGFAISGFELNLFGLNQLPDASQARITVTDGGGGQGTSVTASILLGDLGGPTVSAINYNNGKKLVVKGDGFVAGVQVEINGVVVAPPININVKPTGKKMKIKGNMAALNLHLGSNRVRVIVNGLRSDIFILNL